MRRWFRRFWLLGPFICGAVFLGVLVRGGLAETPGEPILGEPPLVQVVHHEEFGLHVRGVIRLPCTREEVWQVLTDTDRYGDFCPYLHQADFIFQPNQTVELTGRVQGLANTFPVRVHLEQLQLLDEYRASWDGPAGELLENRGRWCIRQEDLETCRVELAVVVAVRRIPTFLVRYVFRRRMGEILQRLSEEVQTARARW